MCSEDHNGDLIACRPSWSTETPSSPPNVSQWRFPRNIVWSVVIRSWSARHSAPCGFLAEWPFEGFPSGSTDDCGGEIFISYGERRGTALASGPHLLMHTAASWRVDLFFLPLPYKRPCPSRWHSKRSSVEQHSDSSRHASHHQFSRQCCSPRLKHHRSLARRYSTALPTSWMVDVRPFIPVSFRASLDPRTVPFSRLR